jgi:hypothetical protein
MDLGTALSHLGSGGAGSLLTYTVFNLVPVLKARIERKNGNGNGSGNGKVCQAEALTQAMTQQAQAMSQQTAILDRVSRNQVTQFPTP